MNKIIFEIIKCTIYFSIPIFLTYLIKIIKSINKKKKEEAELVSLKTVNEIIQTVVMSLEQTYVKACKKDGAKLSYSQQDYAKEQAFKRTKNIINCNKGLYNSLNIKQLNRYIDEMIERKVLELSLNNERKKVNNNE